MIATAAARTTPPKKSTTSRTGTSTAALIARWRMVLPAGVGRQRPKRRWRLANSRSAVSKASGPKSGQSVSHE